jgi:predicted dehydrogenase
MNVAELVATDVDASRKAVVNEIARATWAESVENVLARSPDVVFVCTPTHLHADVAIAALRAGAHVFLEKPIAVTMDDANRIVLEAARTSSIVMVGCNMRFHPGVTALKQALDQSLIGRPWSIRAEFSQYLPDWRPAKDYRSTYSSRVAEGGGIILEAVHEFDYLSWLGGEISQVTGYAEKLSDLEIDGEDSAGLAFRFDSGLVAELHLDYLRYDKARGCEILGSEGIVAWRSYGHPIERVEVKHFDKQTHAWTNLVQIDQWDSNQMYLAETAHFFSCVDGGATPMLDATGGRHVLKMALASRSLAVGGWHALN